LVPCYIYKYSVARKQAKHLIKC